MTIEEIRLLRALYPPRELTRRLRVPLRTVYQVLKQLQRTEANDRDTGVSTGEPDGKSQLTTKAGQTWTRFRGGAGFAQGVRRWQS